MSNSNNNRINIPQAREAGSVGGQMVKRRCVPYELKNLSVKSVLLWVICRPCNT